jgi:hypothetical protein
VTNPYLAFGDDDDTGDDDLGDDDESGAFGYGETMGAFGDDDVSGRGMLMVRRRRTLKKRARAAGARARGLSPAAKIELARGDDIYFGVDSGAVAIAAAASATITVSPQKRNIPQKMFLTAAVATAFLINDIRVGVEPVLATNAAISAAIFIQDSTAAVFRAVICEVGMDFSITVTNISAAGARFTATVCGTWLPAGL